MSGFAYTTQSLLAFAVLLGQLGCSSTTSDGDDSAGATAPAINACAPGDYENATAAADSRVVDISTLTPFEYTPACLIIKIGQSVKFEGNLITHPLDAGTAVEGSPTSPIVSTSSGVSTEFTFPSAGSFPYYCAAHGGPDGSGMAGVVHVVD